LGLALVGVSYTVRDYGVIREEGISSFECGFGVMSGSRVRFSLHFFLIGIVFLIFDVEVVLIIPFPVLFGEIYGVWLVRLLVVFTLLVLIGLYYEWSMGVLN